MECAQRVGPAIPLVVRSEVRVAAEFQGRDRDHELEEVDFPIFVITKVPQDAAHHEPIHGILNGIKAARDREAWTWTVEHGQNLHQVIRGVMAVILPR